MQEQRAQIPGILVVAANTHRFTRPVETEDIKVMRGCCCVRCCEVSQNDCMRATASQLPAKIGLSICIARIAAWCHLRKSAMTRSVTTLWRVTGPARNARFCSSDAP